MFRSLFDRFSFSSGNARRKPSSAFRRVRLGIEALEERAVPSATAISSPVGPMLTNAIVRPVTVTTPAAVTQVPNLTGVTFSLSLTFLGEPYQVSVASETYNADGSAAVSLILKVPKGKGNPGDPTSYQSLYSKLSYDANGQLSLYASWQMTSDSSVWFWGAITTAQNPPVRGSAIPPGWHYDVNGLIAFFQGQQQEEINLTGTGNPPPLQSLPLAN